MNLYKSNELNTGPGVIAKFAVHASLATILLVAGQLATASVPDIPEPRPYTANYQLLRNGEVGADIEARLEALGEGRFRYQLISSNTRGLARFLGFKSREISEFQWSEGQIKPLSYSSSIKVAFSRDEYSLTFDWSAGEVQFNGEDGDETLALDGPVVDALTAQQVLAHSLKQEDTALELPVIDENEIRSRRFEAGATETRQTALGCLKLLRVERIRKPDSERSNWLWLAPELSGLPITIGRDKSDGDKYEMELVSWSGDAADAIQTSCDSDAATPASE